MTKIFVSYSRKDIQRVKRIVNDVNSYGYDCWMDERNLQSGDVWTKEIVKAISSCNIFLLFMSSSSMASDSVRREVQLAFDKKKKIVILRLEETKIPRKLQFQLAGLQWLKASGRNWKTQLMTALDGDALFDRNTHKLKNASGKIRVLLVEDDEMARNAWKKVLNKSDQIQVVGEISLSDFSKSIKNISAPEIIVSGFPFVEKRLIRSKTLLKTWGSFSKTIIICENKEQVKAAYKSYADWATNSPFSDQDLVTWIRSLSDDAKRLCGEYLTELVSIQMGEDQEQQFINLIQRMLQLLFHPELVNPDIIELGRLIFRNQAKRVSEEMGVVKFNEFWEEARHNHGAKYVAIDVHNSEISPSAIQELATYLTNLHGSFGVVIGRGAVIDSLYPLIVELFERDEKVILLLCDAELQEMLEYKAGGINPVCLLQDLYQRLIASAVK